MAFVCAIRKDGTPASEKTYLGSRDDSIGCTVKRRSTSAVRMPFSVKAGRGGQCSFRRRPDHAP